MNTGEIIVGRPREGSSFVSGTPSTSPRASNRRRSRATRSSESGLWRPPAVRSSSPRSESSRQRARPAASSADVSSVRSHSCDRAGSAISSRVRRPRRGAPRAAGGIRSGRVARSTRSRDDRRRRGRRQDTPPAGALGLAGRARPAADPAHRALPSVRAVRHTNRSETCSRSSSASVTTSRPRAFVIGSVTARSSGLALGIDVAHGLHPLVMRDRFQDAWVELLTELTSGAARSRPHRRPPLGGGAPARARRAPARPRKRADARARHRAAGVPRHPSGIRSPGEPNAHPRSV